jgi:coenzyme F420-0:L-glutamate ligase/coenzyme F420-1:gamma-L-glutamate ligase
VRRVEVLAVEGLPEVHPGDDLAELISARADLRDGDVVVVAQKIVSKAEGRIVRLAAVDAGDEAKEIAKRLIAEPDPRAVQVVLDQSVRVLRSERVLITESKQGFVSANAGVDHSNVPGDDALTVLPDNVDASARRICDGLIERTGKAVGVIISDTFGRPWRLGIVNVALGIASAPSLVDLRGGVDDDGKPLHATVLAVADDIAAAAGLVMGKTWRTPAVVVRGLEPGDRNGTGRDLLRPADEDMFR